MTYKIRICQHAKTKTREHVTRQHDMPKREQHTHVSREHVKNILQNKEHVIKNALIMSQNKLAWTRLISQKNTHSSLSFEDLIW